MAPTLTEQLGTITAIVALSLGIVQVLKLALIKYKVDIVAQLPTPVICVAVSMGLTLVGNLVTKTLPGEWYDLLWQAALAAGAASGLFSWLSEPLDSPANKMTPKTPLFLLGALGLSLVLSSGCAGVQWNNTQTWTPEGQLLAARQTFSGTVKSLTVITKAGGFTKEEAVQMQQFVHTAQKCLDRWQAAIELHQPTSYLIDQFNIIIQELLAQRIAAERKLSVEPATPLKLAA